MRAFLSAVLATALFATGALAADGALAPGKPAGVKQAQDRDDNTLLYVAGLGLVAAGIAIAASGGGHHHTATTTTTTSTSP